MGDPKTLKGQVALVLGGGTTAGRHMALALAARGVSVVVAGPDERALGLTVGEIVYGAGKARHVVGALDEAATVRAAHARAVDVFGRLDVVVSVVGAAGTPGTDVGLVTLANAFADVSPPPKCTVLLADRALAHVEGAPKLGPGAHLVAVAANEDGDEDAALEAAERAVLDALTLP